MTNAETGAKTLEDLLNGLRKNDHQLVEGIMKERTSDRATVDAICSLNTEFADKNYGSDGLERYIRSILDYWDDYFVSECKVSSTGKNTLYNVLMSPFKLIAKSYDYLLRKTNSHLTSAASIGAVYGELAGLALFTGETAYYSLLFNLSFLQLFTEEVVSNAAFFIQLPLISGLSLALANLAIVFGASSIFSHTKIGYDEIEADIKAYADRFRQVFGKYNAAFFSKETEPSLANINALYMLSSSKARFAVKTKDGLKDYEKTMLSYISKALDKHINPNLVVHHSPSGVGGFTLIFSSLLGKFFRNNSYSPVFLNTERLNAVPEYLFALFHESAHGAGASSEQMASYYAEKAMEYAQKDFPLEGYDLFLAVNDLESAVSALSYKFQSKEGFFSELGKLGLPRFVEESFDNRFDPIYSITFPVREEMYGGRMESKFSGLYSSGLYIAKKMVEKGRIKTF